MSRSFAALAITASVALAGPVPAEALEGRMQVLLDGFQQDYGFPGATAAIALSDGHLVTVASGLADREDGTPMSPDTRMLAASIGKTFVAMTVLAPENDGSPAPISCPTTSGTAPGSPACRTTRG